MTQADRDTLWRGMVDAGLATGDVPDAAAPASPWFVRAMLGAAGWIGAMFLLGFVAAGLEFVFRSGMASLIAGAMCLGAAWVIFGRASRSDLAGQFGLAVSIAGQSMFVIGLREAGDFNTDAPIFWILMAAFQAAVTVLLPNFVNRVVAAIAGAIAVWIALYQAGLYGLPYPLLSAALAVVWLNEGRWAARGSLVRAAGYALAIMLLLLPHLMGSVGVVIAHRPWLPVALIPWVQRLLMAAVLVYAVREFLRSNGGDFSRPSGLAALAGTLAFAVTTMRAPGVAVACLVLLLGFARGNRALFGLGAAGMLAHLAYYYYSLQMTLLAKSGVLIATGATLLVLHAVMRARFGTTPAQEPANA